MDVVFLFFDTFDDEKSWVRKYVQTYVLGYDYLSTTHTPK